MSISDVLFSSSTWILLIALTNIYLYYYKDVFYEYSSVYSIQVCQKLHCILFSMFLHADESHLFGNMIGFILTSYQIFVQCKRSKTYWHSCFALFFIYFLSGIVGAASNIVLDIYFQQLWKSRIENIQNHVTCSHWFCQKTINLITKPLATAFTYTYHAKEFLAMKTNQFVPRIGASGGIYGLLGARLYTACFSSDHFPLGLIEILWFGFTIWQEVVQIPLNLQELSKATWEDGDMIDHLCHIASLIAGFVLASILQLFFLLIQKG